jgi:hypothetical protein
MEEALFVVLHLAVKLNPPKEQLQIEDLDPKIHRLEARRRWLQLAYGYVSDERKAFIPILHILEFVSGCGLARKRKGTIWAQAGDH